MISEFILASLILSLTLLPSIGLSEERPGKAVFETSPEQGMKLTEKALKNIEVKTTKAVSGSQYLLPLESLVYFQDQVGIYRLRQGWFKLVKVEVMKKRGKESLVRTNEIQSGDEIAIHGADLLRVSEMDAFGSGG